MSAKTHPKWMIVHTKPGLEFLAAYHLRLQGYRVWHWHRHDQNTFHNKGKTTTRRWATSYFSRYLFVRDTNRVRGINDALGVSTVIYGDDPASGESEPLMVPDAALRWLAEDLGMAEDGCIPERPAAKHPISTWPAGTKFFVKDGPFMSFVARMIDAVPQDHKTRFRAYVDIFGRETPVQLDQEQIGEIVNG